MLRTGLWKVVILTVFTLGAAATPGISRDLEVLPAPAPVVVHDDAMVDHSTHLVHDGCCGQTCGHCAPDAHHKYRLTARRALKCEGGVEICMHVVNPACCGCPVEIPMCVPVCCAAEPPVVSNDRGLFGRGVVCIEWPCCGYQARVIFKHHGDLRVVYAAR